MVSPSSKTRKGLAILTKGELKRFNSPFIMEHHSMTQSEIETIKKAQQGDEQAFNKLFHQYKEFVDNLLFCYVKDRDEARDLTNVVFLKVHRKLSLFTEFATFGGWLRILTNRTAIDYLRTIKGRAVDIGDSDGRLPSGLTTASHEGDLVTRLEYESILKELEKYPKKTQQIFHLFYDEDLTVEEISKVLNIPTGTIKAQLARTRRKIQKSLNIQT